MFVRFVVDHLNKQSGINQGILGVAFRIGREAKLQGLDQMMLNDHLDWLQSAFTTPDIFDQPENLKGICWFKQTQSEIISRVKTIVPLVEKCGLQVTELRSDAPGTVIYEDEFQVVAIP